MERNRILYTALLAATIVIGLLTRRFGAAVPTVIAAYAPDALWALAVFWLVGAVWTKATTARGTTASLAFAFCIEISQLFHPAWLDAIRHTRAGGLVLGFGFLWSNIACYIIGVGVGVALDRLMNAPRV